MLASVLKSETALKASIQIVKAFVLYSSERQYIDAIGRTFKTLASVMLCQRRTAVGVNIIFHIGIHCYHSLVLLPSAGLGFVLLFGNVSPTVRIKIPPTPYDADICLLSCFRTRQSDRNYGSRISTHPHSDFVREL